ncbi:class I mannose-6-phosphate isomerase [Parabacteroides sp. OttesenSCG-928-G07]|nr:class I mannose-6-phosphate isomerase [Parabacteroides sp. OttesenSCG-928-G07]
MLHPLKFKPILKELIWGGSKICRFKGISPVQERIGESWEVSDVSGNRSVVANGLLEGKSLDELIGRYAKRLLGDSVSERYGTTFPLLIKFIDAKEDLSIQVHPDDELAKKRHQAWGKTEMWYVIDADPGAKLYVGFSQPVTPEEYARRVADNTLTEVLKSYTVKAGDVFFIPAGTVHAVGSGCFLVEIQQNSDITYRIYDYDRRDANGNKRELHTEWAMEAIDFTCLPDYQTAYVMRTNEPVRLVKSAYFTTNLLDIDTQIIRDYANYDSFFFYVCLKGSATLKDDISQEIQIKQGVTVLIPAETKCLTILPSPKALLLEMFID